jgi:hypothetical protein
MAKIKISFEAEGIEFVNIEVYGGSNPNVYPTMRGVSAVISQYMKAKYKDTKFQIATESYSGGDSAGIYLSPLDTNRETYEKIRKDIEGKFQKGNFNGMEDIYEYSDEGCIKHKGATFAVKYMSVNFSPKYGTIPYQKWEDAGRPEA